MFSCSTDTAVMSLTSPAQLVYHCLWLIGFGFADVDGDKKDARTNGTSPTQPSKAPEPPPRQQSAPDIPFPQPPPPCPPDNATATVELDVKLRSLVLSICTDSVCVGIRMMERFQQYQQHAHLWQGRPQVSQDGRSCSSLQRLQHSTMRPSCS